jgi:hypothetical protein
VYGKHPKDRWIVEEHMFCHHGKNIASPLRFVMEGSRKAVRLPKTSKRDANYPGLQVNPSDPVTLD